MEFSQPVVNVQQKNQSSTNTKLSEVHTSNAPSKMTVEVFNLPGGIVRVQMNTSLTCKAFSRFFLAQPGLHQTLHPTRCPLPSPAEACRKQIHSSGEQKAW